MVRIFIAVTVCYFAGTAAGRGFLPYSLGVPASNFKNDVDMLAVTGMRMTNPELVKHAVSGRMGMSKTTETLVLRGTLRAESSGEVERISGPASGGA